MWYLTPVGVEIPHFFMIIEGFITAVLLLGKGKLTMGII